MFPAIRIPLLVSVLSAGALFLVACKEAPASHHNTISSDTTSDAGAANVNQILSLYEALRAEDVDLFRSLFHEDAAFILPFNVNGDASDSGIQQGPPHVLAQSAFQAYDNIEYIDRTWTVSNNGHVIFVESRGAFINAKTGQPYENRYVTKYEFEDGKIRTLTEYTNPVTQAQNGKAHLSQPQPSPHQ